MNKLTTALLGFLAAAAAAASAQAQASASHGAAFYVEPSAVIAFPGHFDNAVGGALAFGVTINGDHAIEAEVISFKTKEWSDDFTFTPVLATYKYRFVATGKISLTAGASIGATFEKTEYLSGPYPFGYPTGSYAMISESQTAFTSGLVGGASYAFTEHVALDATVRLLRLEETDVTTAGNMVLVTLGVKVRF